MSKILAALKAVNLAKLIAALRKIPLGSLAAAVKAVLADVAQLRQPGNKALLGTLAGAIVAIVASVLGVTLTTAEVSAWLLLASGAAASVEKLLATPAPAPVPAPAPAPTKKVAVVRAARKAGK